MDQGYEALCSRAAWLDLSNRAKIILTGEDRARLLHALTTNHIEQLTPGQGCYAFFLNAQGHILADVNVLCLQERFLLDLEPELRDRILQHLDHYIIADDVVVEDATDQMICVGVEGPYAAVVMEKLGAPAPEHPYSHELWDGFIVARITFTGALGFRLFAPCAQKAGLIQRIESAGAVAASPEAAKIVRLEHAKPRYGEDIFDKTLAPETQQTHAVHYSKGCYIGQEIVERVRSRGMVHRLLVSLHIDGSEPPSPGTKVLANGEEAGKITSAAFSPGLGKVAALGYLRRQFAAPGNLVEVEHRSARVTP